MVPREKMKRKELIILRFCAFVIKYIHYGDHKRYILSINETHRHLTTNYMLLKVSRARFPRLGELRKNQNSNYYVTIIGVKSQRNYFAEINSLKKGHELFVISKTFYGNQINHFCLRPRLH